MIKNRFFKSTIGHFAELVITKALDVSNAAAQQPSRDAFVTNALANTLGVFWDDTDLAVAAGGTVLAANAGRFFYYLYKLADGTVKRTTPIPAVAVKYDSIAYNAGTAQVQTLTLGGAIDASQTVLVKLIETTGTQLPYPIYQYEATGSAVLADIATALATAINAEKSDNSPIATAAAAGAVITITAVDKIRNFKVIVDVQTTVQAPTNNLTAVVAVTVKQVLPIGDQASVKELEQIKIMNGGNPIYNGGGFTAQEFGMPVSSIDAATNYGFVLVRSDRTEKGGIMKPTEEKRVYTIVAIQTADVATLAGK